MSTGEDIDRSDDEINVVMSTVVDDGGWYIEEVEKGV